jgi:hypothetical protein
MYRHKSYLKADYKPKVSSLHPSNDYKTVIVHRLTGIEHINSPAVRTVRIEPCNDSRNMWAVGKKISLWGFKAHICVPVRSNFGPINVLKRRKLLTITQYLLTYLF